ncbi:MAG: Txe/YoeB family addiction module toxin [Rikenellaceae bacterium]
MIYEVIVTPEAREGISKHIKAGNKKLVEKIISLLEEIAQSPRQGRGKPEQLKGREVETWSRRIDSKHRLVYEILEDRLVVYAISAFGHYGDK